MDDNTSLTVPIEPTSSSILQRDKPENVTSSENVSTAAVAFKVEHELSPNFMEMLSFRRMKEGFIERIRVARMIFPYMISISLAYLVTLSLYPGIESEIISCKLKTWM